MKIHKQSLSEYVINDKVRVTKINVLGITFVRFRVLSVVKKDTYYLGNIEIVNDDLPKEVE